MSSRPVISDLDDDFFITSSSSAPSSSSHALVSVGHDLSKAAVDVERFETDLVVAEASGGASGPALVHDAIRLYKDVKQLAGDLYATAKPVVHSAHEAFDRFGKDPNFGLSPFSGKPPTSHFNHIVSPAPISAHSSHSLLGKAKEFSAVGPTAASGPHHVGPVRGYRPPVDRLRLEKFLETSSLVPLLTPALKISKPKTSLLSGMVSHADLAPSRASPGSSMAPPLVGVEPNPGPRRGRKGMSVAVAPVSLGTRIETLAPTILRTHGGTRIRNRELVNAAVAGSTSFTVQQSIALNPGLASLFPWLAPQAQSWQQYVCHRLIFLFVPFVATSTAGVLFMSPNYDASDPPPTSEAQAADNVGTVSDSVWKTIGISLIPKALMGLGPRKYVRPCLIAGDQKTYDMGQLFVITDNCSNTNTIGKLWVEYDFEFFLPQTNPSPQYQPSATSVWEVDTGTWSTGVAANVNWAPSSCTVFDPLGWSSSWSASNLNFTPPAGCYRVEVVLTATDSNTSEAFSGYVVIQKNAASWTQSPLGRVNKLGFNFPSGSFVVPVTAVGFISCNGTDTVAVNLQLTGSAGTLTIRTTYGASLSATLI